jgi:hypothetical protein
MQNLDKQGNIIFRVVPGGPVSWIRLWGREPQAEAHSSGTITPIMHLSHSLAKTSILQCNWRMIIECATVPAALRRWNVTRLQHGFQTGLTPSVDIPSFSFTVP